MLLLEIAMLIGGIYAIVFAKVPSLLVGAGRHPVEGLVARWIGVLLILPLPIAFLGNAILPLLFDKDGAQYAGMLELVTVLGFAILSGVLVRVAGKRVEPVNEKEKKSIKQNWLYIASRLWFAVGCVGSPPALFSVMMFDAPGSSEVLPTILLFWLVVSFPFVCFGSSLGIWLLKNKNEVLAFYVSLLPGLALVLIFAAITWLNVSCHGQFNCQFESTLQEQVIYGDIFFQANGLAFREAA